MRNLAEDVQFFSPAATLAGISEYMDAPRGLRTEGGPAGSKVFPSAQTWLLDDDGKIKVERIVSFSRGPRKDKRPRSRALGVLQRGLDPPRPSTFSNQ